jgi:hypothetical protein
MHGNHPQADTLGASRMCLGTNDTGSWVRTQPSPGQARWQIPRSRPATRNQNLDRTRGPAKPRVDWTTWWLWRGAYTRSHPELGREIPQRPWYCVSRHGRVGRRQVFQSTQGSGPGGKPLPIAYHRGVEQPGSSSGS